MNTNKSLKQIGRFAAVLSLVLFVQLLLFSIAEAQGQGVSQAANPTGSQPGSQPAMVIATVNIYNAVIAGQDGNNFKISFDISNRENVQTGVRYGVQLQKIVNGQAASVADEKVYSETLTLGQNVTQHREVDYQAPNFLSGDFEVWVVSKLDNGMPLAFGKAGMAKLNGSAESVEILPETCFLSVAGDNSKYTLYQGVDIAKNETLRATCDVRNGFKNDVSVIPQLELRYRSDFGQMVSIQKQPAINLKLQEQKSISLVLPVPDKPQAYEAVLRFLDNQGQTVSNATNFHFVLQGESATIQTLTLDKNIYQRGETANVHFLFTPSADSFPGARGKGTSMDVVNLKLDVNDNKGALCGSATETFAIAGPPITQVTIPIDATCIGAVAAAVLTSKDGNVLDSMSPKIQAGSKKLTPPEPVKNKRPWAYVILGLIILALLVVGFMIWKKRKSKKIVMGSILLFFAATAFFFARGANADTFGGPVNHCCMTETTTVGLDKTEYPIAGQIKGMASASYWRICGNGNFSKLQVDATINKQTKNIITRTQGGTDIPLRSTEFTAENSSGTYNAHFAIAWGIDALGTTYDLMNYADIPYDVVGGPVALNLQAIPHCASDGVATLSWRYRDPQNKPQSKFQIQVSENSIFSSIAKDTGEISSDAIAKDISNLKFDTNYYWRLMVWNPDGTKSGWVNGPPFYIASSSKSVGWPDFNWSPVNPNVGQQVTFYPDWSNYLDLPTYYEWSFQNGNPADLSYGNPADPDNPGPPVVPSTTFIRGGDNPVNFKVTDSSGYVCGMEHPVSVTAPKCSSLTVTADKTSVGVGEPISFTAACSDGDDINKYLPIAWSAAPTGKVDDGRLAATHAVAATTNGVGAGNGIQVTAQSGTRTGMSAPFNVTCSVVGDPCATVSDICTNNRPGSCSDLLPSPCVSGSTCGGFGISGNTINWTCSDACGLPKACPSKVMTVSQSGQCNANIDGKALCNHSSLDTSELCAKGIPSHISPNPLSLDSFDISWQCDGSCGGTTVSCSAKGQKSCGWIEANP